MPEQKVIVQNRSGLHARPAALFVRTAKSFQDARIEVIRSGESRDAKSILAILTLGVTQASEITIRTEGAQAEAALAALVGLVEAGLGEGAA